MFGDDDIFGVEIGEVPVPDPVPPVAPIDMGIGVDTIIDSIVRRANLPTPLGGRATTVTNMLMEGRPIAVQLVMEPIGGLSWAEVIRMANGVENVREFIETYATIAMNDGIGSISIAMHAVMEGGAQGVQIAMFTFQWTPPE